MSFNITPPALAPLGTAGTGNRSRTQRERPSQTEWLAALPHLKRRGSEIVGPCPNCGAGDDRLHIRADGLFDCRVCHDGPAILRMVFGRGGRGRADTARYGQSAPRQEKTLTTADKVGPALAAGRLPVNTPAGRYLEGRGAWPAHGHAAPVLWLPPADLERIRGCETTGADGGAVLYPFRKPEGVVAVQWEAVRSDGSRPPERTRRTWGPSKGAAFIASDTVTRPKSAIICEGPLDALAAYWAWTVHGMATADALVIACGGKGAMADFPAWIIPPDIPVIVEADGDTDGGGREAADAVFGTLIDRGCTPRVIYRDHGRDACDDYASMVRDITFEEVGNRHGT